MNRIAAVLLALFLLLSTREARAFCGFYVSGSDGPLVNNATQVVLMRDGMRTVLSMQNNYQGPPADFAMVIPVPVVLSKDNVKTLPREVFDKVEKLDAPRLVEYWEQDPCAPQVDEERVMAAAPGMMKETEDDSSAKKKDYGVKIEAKFSVGEYDIVILSAKDSGGLDAWLRDEKYKVPAGSEPFLRPYVQRGSKFFVAKVNAKKLRFGAPASAAGGASSRSDQDKSTMLSPLRFHYDSQEFSLPIRLGLVNAGGAQDLIVHVLAKGQRYEVANYPNVAVPTNLEVSDATRQQFPSFYAALFDRVLEKNPKAIVTEYSWQAGSCDPCPVPPLDVDTLAVLGADVLPSLGDQEDPYSLAGSFVLTRLHARYTKESLGADLVFRAARGIVGGREHLVAPASAEGGASSRSDQSAGKLERGAVSSEENNFQARYIIRHRWEGAITCANPVRNVWGGPPGEGGGRRRRNTNNQPPQAAQNLAFAPRGKVQLATFIREDSAELDVKATPASQGDPPLGVVVPPATHSCGCNLGPSRATASLAALLVPIAALVVRRRRRA